MKTMKQILDTVRKTSGCKVDPPRGQPKLPKKISLPDDLRTFYELAGGAMLFENHKCSGHQRILSPHEFQRIDLTITGEMFASGPFPWWFAIADVRDGNYIVIDLNPDHFGLCYDAFHETFAMPGYANVIASSFTDLLRRLINHKEDSTYWLQEDFKPLGEAFALYGYKSVSPDDQSSNN